MSVVKCPVCNKTIEKTGNVYKCENKHSFDISNKGYCNLLLANQKFSDSSGDDKEMILARKEFFELDLYKPLKNELLRVIKECNKKEKFTFLDIACGEGYYTNFLIKSMNKYAQVCGYGIDISKSAIHEANKQKRMENIENVEYFIANLNKLPFMDNSIDVMLNCFAPIDEKEFCRVLKKDGIYIRVLPGEKHLYGLKKAIYDNPYLNAKKEEKLGDLKLIYENVIGNSIKLNSNKDIINLFKMTPYFYKTGKSDSEKLNLISELDTDISFEIRVYTK